MLESSGCPYKDLQISLRHYPSLALEITNLFSISMILSFQKYYMHGIIQNIPFWDWISFYSS